LGEVKMTHPSIDLNLMLAEYKESPSRIAAVAKKISK
jgi:hypothetical protein